MTRQQSTCKIRSIKQFVNITAAIVMLLWLGRMSILAAAQPPEEKSPILANTRVDVLWALSRAWEQAARENRARALQLAQQHGWVVRQELPNGRLIELVGVDRFDRPFYNTTDNAAAADTIATDAVHAGGSAGLSLSGSGFTVGIWDGGAVLSTHQEFQNLTSPTLSRVTQRDETTGSYFHATHVAGTLIARGANASAKGMAPHALLDSYEWTDDTSEMATAGGNGLLVSNHSYGYVCGWEYANYGKGTGWYWFGNEAIDQNEDYLFGFYYSTTATWDTIAFNAPYYLIVKSAGNDRSHVCPDPTAGHFVLKPEGYPNWTSSTYNRVNRDGGSTGYDTINPRGNAKNIVTVGAVNDIVGGYTQASDVIMTAYSGWGPTDDGRIKPDLVGNGQGLYSASNSSTTAYAWSSGTSMASPNVAGSLLLLQEYFNTLHAVPLRSASVKALAIHTADEAGSSDGPDYQYGWGLMNTAAAAAVITENGNHALIAEETLEQGATYTRNVMANGNEALAATIVWTDPPGTSPSFANLTSYLDPPNLMLINDLDLRMVHDATTYSPWVLDPANPANAAATGDNFRDNVEQVKIVAPPAGDIYTITVAHKGTLTYAPQAFSLIVTGIQPEPTITPTPEPTITPTPTPDPTVTPTPTPDPTVTPTPTPDPTVTPTPEPTVTPTPIPDPTVTPTMTPTPKSAENYLLWTR